MSAHSWLATAMHANLQMVEHERLQCRKLVLVATKVTWVTLAASGGWNNVLVRPKRRA